MPFHDRQSRWGVIVAHRRAGKTVACINDLIRAALTATKPDARFAYIAPYFAQAKDIAWDYLCRYSAPIPGTSFNITELRIDYPNGARIRLYGAENAERMRGLYLDGVIIDEPADIDPRVWPEILRPALADRKGWAVWIGTPKGKNAFWDTWQQAKREDWFHAMLKASETKLVDQAELDAAKKDMTDDQYQQEFECSFEAAILGAYYGKLMTTAENDKRIARCPYDPKLQVYTAWDLGIGDPTAIWFCQQLGTEVRLIDYYETSGVGLDHYVKVLRDKPYVYAMHYLPHDVEAADMGSGKTRLETLTSLGMKRDQIRVVRLAPVDDGINAARLLIPRCWFDADKCARGIEALRQYRAEFDDKLKTLRSRPLHDWTSHGCLIGDSIIQTEYGDRRIDEIRVGDRVRTPAGYARVLAAGPVKRADDLIVVTTADGRSLTCTPEHKFFTECGIVTADALRYSDHLTVDGDDQCRRALLLSRAANIGFREAITELKTGGMARRIFTELYGKMPMARYHMATMSITEMRTGLIAIFKTWNAYQAQTISALTRCGDMLMAFSSPQATNAVLHLPSGTSLPMVGSGIASTERELGRAENGMMPNAKNVAGSSKRHTLLAPNSVISIARWQRSEGAEESQLVFDLTVEKHHCYWANGLLVSNSDAFRYLAQGLTPPAKKAAKGGPQNPKWVV